MRLQEINMHHEFQPVCVPDSNQTNDEPLLGNKLMFM